MASRAERSRAVERALPLALLALAACDGPATTEPADPAPAPDRPADSPLLVDHTAASGLAFVHVTGARGNRELPETMGGGVGLLDHDGDGDLDLYAVQSGPLRRPGGGESRSGGENELWAGDGSGRFARVASAAGADDAGYGMGCAVGDVDGDGRDDLLVLQWGPNALYLSDGERGFVRSDEPALAADRWSVSGAFVDADADGDLDLYVVNYVVCPPASHLDERVNPRAPLGFSTYPSPDVFPAEADRLFRNDGGEQAPRLVDVTEGSGADGPGGKGLGVVVTDVDLDGVADLYVANDGTPNFLLRGLGELRFEARGRRLGVAYNDDGNSEAGMGVDAGDVDGDGDFDLFVTNLDDETNSLYLNSGAVFRDRTSRLRLSEPSRSLVGFGTQLEDLDLDGDLDLVVCNGHIFDNAQRVYAERTHAQANQLFLNDGGSFALAPNGFGELAPLVSRGSAVGDVDGDGRVDLVVGNNGGPARLYLGRPPEERARVRIVLEGPRSNPRGLGATLRLELDDGTTLLRRIESARSYASASEAAVVTGLPPGAGAIASVVVTWADGARETFDGAAAGELRLRRGAGR